MPAAPSSSSAAQRPPQDGFPEGETPSPEEIESRFSAEARRFFQERPDRTGFLLDPDGRARFFQGNERSVRDGARIAVALTPEEWDALDARRIGGCIGTVADLLRVYASIEVDAIPAWEAAIGRKVTPAERDLLIEAFVSIEENAGLFREAIDEVATDGPNLGHLLTVLRKRAGSNWAPTQAIEAEWQRIVDRAKSRTGAARNASN